MHQYRLVEQKGEGTFSIVFEAQSLRTGQQVAIKCMKSYYNTIEQVQKLREIQALNKVQDHQNIIKLIEVLYDEPTGRLALVFELMEQNLYESIRGRKKYLTKEKVRNIMYQLLKSIDYIHKKGIFHRDIKPENILIRGEQVKLADFGSCKSMLSKHPFTEYISTRWYRPPECLLTDGYYDFKMDIWGAGCIMFEIVSLFPLFPGDNELDQVHKIHKILGTPEQKILDRFQKNATHMEFNFPQVQGTGIASLLQKVSQDTINLIELMLTYDPTKRITASEALRHPYFEEIHWMHYNQILQKNQNLMSHSLSPQKYQSPTNRANQIKKVAQQTQTFKNTHKSKNFNSQSNSSLQYHLGDKSINNKFNQTQKYQPYKEQSENAFVPVLQKKKAKKKKKFGLKSTTNYHGNTKDSGTEDEGGQQSSSHIQLLFPPLQQSQNNINQQQGYNNNSSYNSISNIYNSTQSNLDKYGYVTSKYKDYNNPFKNQKLKKGHQYYHSPSQKNTINQIDYTIVGNTNFN